MVFLASDEDAPDVPPVDAVDAAVKTDDVGNAGSMRSLA